MNNINNSKTDCFGFRSIVDAKGKGIVYGPDNKRYVQNESPLYGNRRWCSAIDAYRYKCILLVFASIPKGVISLIHRTWDMTRLGSLRRAVIYSEIDCRKLDFKDKQRKIHLMGLRKLGIYAYNFTTCLVKDLAKLATFPIQLVAIECFALLGTIFPKYGRFLIAKTQILWEFDNLLERRGFAANSRLVPKFSHYLNSSAVHYIAPCFLSLEDFNRLNLYMYLPRSHPKELRNLALALQNALITYKELLPPEHFAEFSKKITDFKNEEVKKHSAYSGNEIILKNGQLTINSTLNNSETLEKMRKKIEDVQTAFEKYINCEINLNALATAFDTFAIDDSLIDYP